MIELWGGIEATICRIKDTFKEQLEKNGHKHRIQDIDTISKVGFKALRYPVLWEQAVNFSLHNKPDLSWAKERLPLLRDKGIRPIAGLVHHGSGPAGTGLLDSSFPDHLANYAYTVAKEFDWLDAYTPVNEPNTTARFSGLYGQWFPHSRNDMEYLRMLYNQCKATVLSMQAIRSINPDAQLIQTEDIGKIYSTPKLRHQAIFENHRRWLSLDLLTGKVDKHHPLWGYFISSGFREEKILWFQDNPCPPDIIGINYYITSERVLDDNLEHYPLDYHWGNCDYADIEAVRVTDIAGHYPILKETWDRYRLPIALTEVHINANGFDQLRWIKMAWDAGKKLKEEGVDFRAVTIWSILGAFDWNTLLTQDNNYYEAGLFDIQNGTPNPTHLYDMIEQLAKTGDYTHECFCERGWWESPERYLFSQPREFERF